MKYGCQKDYSALNAGSGAVITIDSMQHVRQRGINNMNNNNNNYPKKIRANNYEKQSYCVRCDIWMSKTLRCPECGHQARNNNRRFGTRQAKRY